MNMTNEPIRPRQFTPGKGDTQQLYVTSALRNGSIPRRNGSHAENSNQKPPAATEKPLDTPIQPPRDPAKRLEFWLDTCRGFAHIKFGCAQIQELYRKHGCRFAEPTAEQVRGILSALDGAMPQWEKEHPELFYQTLELSFPELLIRR